MFYKRRYLELKAEHDKLKADFARNLSAAAAIERAIGKAEAEAAAKDKTIEVLEAQLREVRKERKEVEEKGEQNLHALQAKLRRAKKQGEIAEKRQGLFERVDECFGTGIPIEEAIKRGAYFPKLEAEKQQASEEPTE